MLSGILSSAISGLSVNAQRVAAAADNVANASTPGYKRVEIQSKTLATHQTSTTSYAPGGVLAMPRQLSNVQNGAVEPSTTDFGTEFATIISARASYSASLKVISAAEDMARALIDLRA